MKVNVWQLLGLIFITFFALSAVANVSATPTMSSMAGTYVEQTSSGTGYTIILYENGTGVFDAFSGTWTIVNSTTLEGTYGIIPINSYFTITNNGFTAVSTGNVYVKTTSASSSPTASASANPTLSPTLTSAPVSASPTLSPTLTSAPASASPTVPEFSNAALVLVVAAIAVVTLYTIELAAKKRHAEKS